MERRITAVFAILSWFFLIFSPSFAQTQNNTGDHNQNNQYNYNKIPEPFEHPPSIHIYGGLDLQDRPNKISFELINGSSERGSYGSFENVKSLQLYTIESGGVIKQIFQSSKRFFDGQFNHTILYDVDIHHYGVILISCVQYLIPDKGSEMYTVQAFSVHRPRGDNESSQVNDASGIYSYPETSDKCIDHVLALINHNSLDQVDMSEEDNSNIDFKIDGDPQINYLTGSFNSMMEGTWWVQLKFNAHTKSDIWNSIPEISFDGSEYHAPDGEMQKIFLTQQIKISQAYSLKSIFLKYVKDGRNLMPFPLEIPIDFMLIAREEEKKQLLHDDAWIDCNYDSGRCSLKWIQNLMLAVQEIRYGSSPSKLDNVIVGAAGSTDGHYQKIPPFQSPSVSKIFAQIIFFDGSKSDVRSMPAQ